MIYSITFDQDSIDSKSKSNDQILNENTTQLRNLDEVKKYSKGLNSKITILDKEIKTYNDMLTDCLDLYKSLYVKAQSASVIKEKMKDIIEGNDGCVLHTRIFFIFAQWIVSDSACINIL